MRKILLAWLIAAFALSSVVLAQDAPIPLSDFTKSTLKIATPDARMHPFSIWVAMDDVHREQGLMFVKSMPRDAGMLFVYSAPRRIALWMKNTFIPLDMVFIRADGRVSSVEHGKPHSEDIIQSKEDVIAVLELNEGTAARLNIGKGAVVMHPFFERKTQ